MPESCAEFFRRRLFLGLAAARQLHCTQNLAFNDGVEFRPTGHAKRFQFRDHDRECYADRTPLVQKRANVREGRRLLDSAIK